MYSVEHKNVVISISTADKRRNHIIAQFGQKQIPFEFFDAFTPSDRLDAHLQRYLPNVEGHIKAHGRREGLFGEPLHAMEKVC